MTYCKIFVHGENYSSPEEAKKNGALYQCGSEMANNYTVLADIQEAVEMTSECLGSKVTLYVQEKSSNKFILLNDHLKA